MPKLQKLAIAVPTYNEAKNIRKLIPAIHKVCKKFPKINFVLLIIDDNSPDNTAAVAEATAKQYKLPNLSVRVLKRKAKNGLGKAYVDGFKHLLNQPKPFDFILQMDADLSHNPIYINEFIMAAESGHDLVVASRYIKGGGTPDWGLHRKFLSRGGNLYTRLLLDSRLTDYTGGFNMYSTDVLNKVGIETLNAGGYGFLLELKYRALQQSKSATQIPIVFRDRLHGQSKIPKSTLFKSFFLVLRIKLKTKP